MRKILFFVAPSIAIAQVLQAPYATPTFASLSSGAWPNDSEWASLNRSVGGRLQALRPWAAVCYTSDPLYNAEECQSVLSLSTLAFFGYKYAELSSIKLKYDPHNFFTSWKGVASVTDLPAYQCFINQQNKLLYQA